MILSSDIQNLVLRKPEKAERRVSLTKWVVWSFDLEEAEERRREERQEGEQFEAVSGPMQCTQLWRGGEERGGKREGGREEEGKREKRGNELPKATLCEDSRVKEMSFT